MNEIALESIQISIAALNLWQEKYTEVIIQLLNDAFSVSHSPDDLNMDVPAAEPSNAFLLEDDVLLLVCLVESPERAFSFELKLPPAEWSFKSRIITHN